jgi:hypothetical protein
MSGHLQPLVEMIRQSNVQATLFDTDLDSQAESVIGAAMMLVSIYEDSFGEFIEDRRPYLYAQLVTCGLLFGLLLSNKGSDLADKLSSVSVGDEYTKVERRGEDVDGDVEDVGLRLHDLSFMTSD